MLTTEYRKASNGPVMLLPTATDDKVGAEKWTIGPALGFVARNEKLMWGVFNQNLFSFAGDSDREDVKVSIVQPIVNYSLPEKWSIGTSEMNITYDWEKSDWTALPLGVKLAKLIKFGTLPVQFAASYEYNFADDYVSPAWTVNFTVAKTTGLACHYVAKHLDCVPIPRTTTYGGGRIARSVQITSGKRIYHRNVAT